MERKKTVDDRITIYPGKELISKLEKKAKEEGRTVSGLSVYIIKKYIDKV